MENTEANKRFKIIQFYEKYGLEATIEAFNVSKRIYRWKSIIKGLNTPIEECYENIEW